jgi:hypothetical protein
MRVTTVMTVTPWERGRFVRAVNKDMPKIVHFQDAAVGLAREGISTEALAGIYQGHACDISFTQGGSPH